MVSIEEARTNILLDTLNEEELNRLLPKLQPVRLPLGNVLFESGTKLDFAMFPTSAVVSLLYVSEEGLSAEIGIVGNDGMLGISLFLGGHSTISRAVVYGEGCALQISAEDFRKEFALSGRFPDLLLLYTQALITQISLTAVCHRLHNTHERICRWLLLTLDRQDSNVLLVTHELISDMVGVRRESVSLATEILANGGMIEKKRGSITVIDRKAVEQCACECYQTVKWEFKRLLELFAEHHGPRQMANNP